MAKYEVLRGNHSEGRYPKGHPQAGSPIVYEPGEVVETENCLLKFNSAKPGALGQKFRLVDDDRVQATDKISIKPAVETEVEAQPDDGLVGLTLSELRELARGDSIDLGSAKSKTEVLKVMRETYSHAGA